MPSVKTPKKPRARKPKPGPHPADRSTWIDEQVLAYLISCRFQFEDSELLERAAGFGLSAGQYAVKVFRDFKFCLHELWHYAGKPAPAAVQYDIADWLEHGPTSRLAEAFRGVAKTWIFIAYCLWRLLRDIREQILILSASEAHTRDSMHQMRSWLGNAPFLRHLAPRARSRDRDSALRFDVAFSHDRLLGSGANVFRGLSDEFAGAGGGVGDRIASVTAKGTTGQITGSRATIIGADDIETKENSMTRSMRQLTLERMTEYTKILVPGGDLIYLGNPHHESESLYFKLPEMGIATRSWPSRYPTPSQRQGIPHLAPMLARQLDSDPTLVGKPVWPERFSEEVLLRDYLMGPTKHLLQMMLLRNLTATHRYPLRLADFIVFPVNRDKAPATIAWGQSTNRGPTVIEDIEPVGYQGDFFYAPVMVDQQWYPYQVTRAYIDPAGGGMVGRDPDKIGLSIIGGLHGYLHVKLITGLAGGPTTENLRRIANLLYEHRATECQVETNFGGDMLIQLLTPIIAQVAQETRKASILGQGGPEGGLLATNGDKGSKGRDGSIVDPGASSTLWHCLLVGIHNTGQKEHRIIDTLESVMASHRLILDPSVAANKEAMYQVTRITRERGCLDHDDEADSLAGCVASFRPDLDLDARQVSEQRRQQTLDKELEDYYASFGQSSPAPNWLHLH